MSAKLGVARLIVRVHHVRVTTSDRKWPLKKRPVIAHIKGRSKCSLTINRNHFDGLNWIWFELDMVAMGWCCSAPNDNEVSSSVGGVTAQP
jgi:hypothetical protein